MFGRRTHMRMLWGEVTIFNIGGNKYRLATLINYRTGKVFIRQVMTHEEYTRKDWRKA